MWRCLYGWVSLGFILGGSTSGALYFLFIQYHLYCFDYLNNILYFMPSEKKKTKSNNNALCMIFFSLPYLNLLFYFNDPAKQMTTREYEWWICQSTCYSRWTKTSCMWYDMSFVNYFYSLSVKDYDYKSHKNHGK